MNIHEYQAKQLLKSFGCPVSIGYPIYDASEARSAASKLDGPLWVVKAQIHAGAVSYTHLTLQTTPYV